jgi:hypothetical protein
VSEGHTPGPWLLSGATVYALDETGTCNRFSVRPDGGWTYRSPGSLGSTGDRTTEAELQANARLISAAPELLDALTETARDMREAAHKLREFGVVLSADILCAQAAKSEAAIARARGEQA